MTIWFVLTDKNARGQTIDGLKKYLENVEFKSLLKVVDAYSKSTKKMKKEKCMLLPQARKSNIMEKLRQRHSWWLCPILISAIIEIFGKCCHSDFFNVKRVVYQERSTYNTRG
jgi:hypothetical protein